MRSGRVVFNRARLGMVWSGRVRSGLGKRIKDPGVSTPHSWVLCILYDHVFFGNIY